MSLQKDMLRQVKTGVISNIKFLSLIFETIGNIVISTLYSLYSLIKIILCKVIFFAIPISIGAWIGLNIIIHQVNYDFALVIFARYVYPIVLF